MAFTNPGSTIWRDYVTDGVPASGANEPYKPDIRAWAAEVETQLSGDTARVGMPYKYAASTTTNADPGAGYFRLNNIDPTLVNEIAISKTDNNGLGSGSWIATWDDSSTLLDRGKVTFRALDGDWEATYQIVDDLIDGTTYWRVPVSYIGKTGTLVANDVAGVVFTPTGDRGGNNHVIDLWLPGDALPASNEVLLRRRYETDVTYPGNFAGSSLASKVAAPEDAVYQIYKMASINDLVGTQVGTVTIAEATKTATFTSSGGSPVTFETDTYIELRAPNPPVAGIEDLTGNLVGTQDV